MDKIVFITGASSGIGACMPTRTDDKVMIYFLLQQFFVYSLIHFQKKIITTAIYYNSVS